MLSKGNSIRIPPIQIDLDITSEQDQTLLEILQTRFGNNMNRHKGLEWSKIQAKLEAHPERLGSLYAMQSTGGEPDVIAFDEKTTEYIFVDCSEQSPLGRRSICYDGAAQVEREKKGISPAGNAVELAAAMGIELLNEEQYRALQELGEFDTKSESWIYTPEKIRNLGGALFADRRYDTVFVFHNSAPSFYASRGFRGALRV